MSSQPVVSPRTYRTSRTPLLAPETMTLSGVCPLCLWCEWRSGAGQSAAGATVVMCEAQECIGGRALGGEMSRRTIGEQHGGVEVERGDGVARLAGDVGVLDPVVVVERGRCERSSLAGMDAGETGHGWRFR